MAGVLTSARPAGAGTSGRRWSLVAAVVLTALKAQARIPEHQTEGRITVHAVSGHLVVHAEGRTFDLRAGAVLALDQGVRHDVEAVEDSAFLLTIAWPGRTDGDAS